MCEPLTLNHALDMVYLRKGWRAQGVATVFGVSKPAVMGNPTPFPPYLRNARVWRQLGLRSKEIARLFGRCTCNNNTR